MKLLILTGVFTPPWSLFAMALMKRKGRIPAVVPPSRQVFSIM